eukprot:7125287-Pyramimonas_sp.AAC.1
MVCWLLVAAGARGGGARGAAVARGDPLEGPAAGGSARGAVLGARAAGGARADHGGVPARGGVQAGAGPVAGVGHGLRAHLGQVGRGDVRAVAERDREGGGGEEGAGGARGGGRGDHRPFAHGERRARGRGGRARLRQERAQRPAGHHRGATRRARGAPCRPRDGESKTAELRPQ